MTEALEHPYLTAYHDPSDEPSCPTLFDKWEEVEGLEDVEGFRKAIEREVNEFRAEVRAVDDWDGEEGESSAGDGGEERMLISGEVGGEGWRNSPREVLMSGTAAGVVTGNGEPLEDGAVEGEIEGLPALPTSQLGSIDNSSTDGLPPDSTHAGLTHSHHMSRVGQAKAMTDSMSSSSTSSDAPLSPNSSVTPSNTRPTPTPSHSRSHSEVYGHNEPGPLSASSSSASRPRNPRRPSSGFFDPFSRRPQSLCFTPSGSAATTPYASGDPSPSQSQMHSSHPPSTSEVIPRPAGVRSRQQSASGEAFRPLLRSLSTVSITDAHGRGHLVGGFSKLSPAPPISAGVHTVMPCSIGTGNGGNSRRASLSVVPPMAVSPSDAPPSELPHEFEGRLGLSRRSSGGGDTGGEDEVLGFKTRKPTAAVEAQS